MSAVGIYGVRANSLGNLANVHRYLGDLPQALERALETLRLLTLLNDTRGQALTLGNLALIAHHSGDHSAALNYGEQAVLQFRRLGDHQNLTTGLMNMSIAARSLGRHRYSAELLGECLDISVQLGAHRYLGIVLTCTGVLSKEWAGIPPRSS